MSNINHIIFLATDHGGYYKKEDVKKYLLSNISPKLKVEVIDFGASIYNKDDNYPDFVHQAAKALSDTYMSGNSNASAFVFGRSGTGEGIIMNKYKDIRCLTMAHNDLDLVRLSREHDDVNAISFGADFINIDNIIESIDIFFNTDFQGGIHSIRVNNIEKLL